MTAALIGAAVVAGGAQIYSSNQASKAASEASGARMPIALNPGQQQLNYLFGQNTNRTYSRRGNPATWDTGYAAGDVFGDKVYNNISAFLNNPSSMVPGTNTPLWASLFDSAGGFQNLQNRFATGIQGAIGTAAELTQTGIPTNGSAYFDDAIRRLRTEVTPMLAEQSGFGTQGSGFLQGGYQAGADLLGQASLANIDLQEAATNRRMSAAPLLSTLLAAEQSVPINVGVMLSEISNQERLAPTNLFQSLLGSGGQNYATPGFNPQSSGANYGAAMTGLSGILNSLGQFDFSSYGTGSRPSTTNTTNNYGVKNPNNNPNIWGSTP